MSGYNDEDIARRGGRCAVKPREARLFGKGESAMPMERSALDKEERAQAEEMTGVKTSVIYEAIRAEGEHELSRSFGALWWSGVIAGVTISLSVVSMGFLQTVLPDAPWAPAVVSLGYPVGFLIVILGRMQLFTENTVTPILSLFHRPTRQNFLRTVRLWGIVFSANMTGYAQVREEV